MFADDTGLSDDDACAVVDAEMMPDDGAGMDVDACLRVGYLCDYAWQQWHAGDKQRVSYAVVEHAREGGITENHFSAVGRRRVVGEHGADVGEEQLPDRRQCFDEFTCGAVAHRRVGAGETAGAPYLSRQFRADTGYAYGGEMTQHFGRRSPFVEKIWKHHLTNEPENVHQAGN